MSGKSLLRSMKRVYPICLDEGQVLVGTFDELKVGDKVRIRYFSFETTITQIDYERDFATIIWVDDEGNTHTETNTIDDYVKIV